MANLWRKTNSAAQNEDAQLRCSILLCVASTFHPWRVLNSGGGKFTTGNENDSKAVPSHRSIAFYPSSAYLYRTKALALRLPSPALNNILMRPQSYKMVPKFLFDLWVTFQDISQKTVSAITFSKHSPEIALHFRSHIPTHQLISTLPKASSHRPSYFWVTFLNIKWIPVIQQLRPTKTKGWIPVES